MAYILQLNNDWSPEMKIISTDGLKTLALQAYTTRLSDEN